MVSIFIWSCASVVCILGLEKPTTGYSVGLWLSTRPLYVLTSSQDPVILWGLAIKCYYKTSAWTINEPLSPWKTAMVGSMVGEVEPIHWFTSIDLVLIYIPYSGKFSRKKTFTNWWKIWFLWRKLADCSLVPCRRAPCPQILWRKLSQIATKLRNSRKFSPSKVFHYTVVNYLNCHQLIKLLTNCFSATAYGSSSTWCRDFTSGKQSSYIFWFHLHCPTHPPVMYMVFVLFK